MSLEAANQANWTRRRTVIGYKQIMRELDWAQTVEDILSVQSELITPALCNGCMTSDLVTLGDGTESVQHFLEWMVCRDPDIDWARGKKEIGMGELVQIGNAYLVSYR